jgi:DNA-binding MarR family transcriptional regulator
VTQEDLFDLVAEAECIHRQFLATLRVDLERLQRRDVNDVRAWMLLSIGEAEMTARELTHRGGYLGANVTYNLAKLADAGYVTQTRSSHDRRLTVFRNTERGLELCAELRALNAGRLTAFNEANRDEDLQACRQSLRRLQHFWNPTPEVNDLAGERLARGAAADQPDAHWTERQPRAA